MTRENTFLYVGNDHDYPPSDLLRRIALTNELSSLRDDQAVYDLKSRDRTTLYTRYPADSSNLRRSGNARKKRSALEMQRLHNLKRQERVLSEPVHLPAIGRRVGPGVPTYALRNFANTLGLPGRETPRSRWRLGPGHTSTDRTVDSVTVHKAVSYDLGERLGDIADLKASVRRQMERYREWHDDQRRRHLQDTRVFPDHGGRREQERLQCTSVSKEIVQRKLTRSKCHVHHAEDRSSGAAKVTQEEKVAEENGCHRDGANRFGKKRHRVMGLPPVDSTVVYRLPQEICAGKLSENRVEANGNCSPTPKGLGDCDRDSLPAGDARPDSPPAQVPAELLIREFSAKTWKTWRNVNESDAYMDVKQYIEDNDLMSAEKSSRIYEWMESVDPASPDSPSPSQGGAGEGISRGSCARCEI